MQKIAKEQFLKYIKDIQNAVEYDLECSAAAREHHIDFSESNTSYLACIAVDLLEIMFDCYSSAGYGDISYFCYELDFGKKWKPGMVTDQDKDGNEIDVDFSSAEKLWEYLNNNNNNRRS